MAGWIVYFTPPADPNQLPIDEWLEHNSPSKLSRQNGVDWIYVRKTGHAHLEPDLEGLEDAWADLLRSGRAITVPEILSFATTHDVTSGKWLAYGASGPVIDQLWTTIAKALTESRLGPATGAKVSPLDGTGRHVICVYNEDCTNEAQVYAVEAALREAGVRTRLCYKPDVYTHVGIYKSNPWKLRPTLYLSNYNAVLHNSQITRQF